MSEYVVSVEPSPSDEVIQTVRRGLIDYNLSRAAIDEVEKVAVLLRDARGEIVGGAIGQSWGEVLEVHYLWIDEALRGQGFGRRALAEIEAFGREHGCRLVTLDTFSFQAPDFYRRAGYELFGEVAGYPEGHKKFFFKKSLV